MTDTPPIDHEIALRIALAARALPEVGAARLIRVIEDMIGLPPTAERLSGLAVKDLKSALGGELANMDGDLLEEAVQILAGEYRPGEEPPPALDGDGDDGDDLPDSIRVACASNNGELLDGHFGTAQRFLVYQVSASQNRLIGVRVPDDVDKDARPDAPDKPRAEDKNESRARLLGDCQILYVASIGGPAAAKVVKAGIHPIKDPKGGSARDRIQALQAVLADKTPPWLAKVMGRPPQGRVLFELDEARDD